VKPFLPKVLAASSCSALIILLISGCSSPRASQAGGSALESDPQDPFGWSTRIDQGSKGDLGPMVSTCQQGSDLVEQFQNFAEPCRLMAKGLTLKFERYYLDGNKRVVAISGMHPDLDTYRQLKGLMKDQTGVAQYAGVCIRLGNNSLPELTVTSKDHCEQLNLGLI
jgi:hypothetical protein